MESVIIKRDRNSKKRICQRDDDSNESPKKKHKGSESDTLHELPSEILGTIVYFLPEEQFDKKSQLYNQIPTLE
jgi:hypothetical protein